MIPTKIVPSASPRDASPREVAREFHALLDAGARLLPAGEARCDPPGLLRSGYTPRHRVDLFDTTYYLTDARQNEDIRFYVAYVAQGRRIFPRIFYKDVSLVWRSASHFIRSDHDNWIGKGALVTVVRDGVEYEESAEETTDLPTEIQTALEEVLRRASRVRRDRRAIELVLRRGPDGRLDPYRDFTGPRRRAQADPRNLIHTGRPIARFTRDDDPTSLRFAPGFEPDFAHGVLEIARSTSRLYGGALRRFRIVSRNRKVQFLFFAGRRHAWIGHPQATTTQLSSFGLRTIDVVGDDRAFMPGYEYHFFDEAEDPAVLVSQIPRGFAGRQSRHDPSRADASPWIDRMPVIREFRRRLRQRRLQPSPSAFRPR